MDCCCTTAASLSLQNDGFTNTWGILGSTTTRRNTLTHTGSRGIFEQSLFSLEQLLSEVGGKRRQYCPVVNLPQAAHKRRYELHVQGARHKPETTKKRAPASSSVGGGSRLCAKFSLAPSNQRASVMPSPRCPTALSDSADTAWPAAAAAGGEYALPLPRSSHFIPQKSDTVCQNSPTSETDHRWRSGQLRVQRIRSGD